MKYKTMFRFGICFFVFLCECPTLPLLQMLSFYMIIYRTDRTENFYKIFVYLAPEFFCHKPDNSFPTLISL